MNAPHPINRGISLRELDRMWLDAGGTIRRVGTSSELRYVWGREESHAYASQRKDAPLKLIMFVRKHLPTQEITMHNDVQGSSQRYPTPMNLGSAPTAEVKQLQAHTEQLAKLGAHLEMVGGRLFHLNNRLFGAQPQSAAGAGAPALDRDRVPVLQECGERVASLQRIISIVETEVDRLEQIA